VETVESFILNGEQRYVLVTKFPIFDEQGTVTMVGGMGVDIRCANAPVQQFQTIPRWVENLLKLSSGSTALSG